MTERPRLAVGYWSDPLCIWAFVAQSKLDRVAEEFNGQLQFDYHVVPVFGSVPWRFKKGPWVNEGVEGRVEATRRIASENGFAEVTGEIWKRDPPASSWSPGAAIKAVFALEAEGEIAQGTAADFQWRLRKRLFLDNKNVARREEQLAVAEQLGLSRAPIERRLDDGSALSALWEDHLLKEQLRIQGSPTYVFDHGRAMLYGNFDFSILEATIRELTRGLSPGASAC